MISFSAIPQRDVEAPDGSTWHIVLRRGWWQRSPHWWRRISRVTDNLVDGEGALILSAPFIAIYLVAIAPRDVCRVVRYYVKRRSDWVVVGERHGARWDAAIICERYSTKEKTAERAEAIVRMIKAGPSD